MQGSASLALPCSLAPSRALLLGLAYMALCLDVETSLHHGLRNLKLVVLYAEA